MLKFITKFEEIGPCKIDIELVVSKWNHLFEVHQWREEYRLIKYKRKNSPSTDLKCTIDNDVAKQLIDRKNLQPYSGGFASATTWK